MEGLEDQAVFQAVVMGKHLGCGVRLLCLHPGATLPLTPLFHGCGCSKPAPEKNNRRTPSFFQNHGVRCSRGERACIHKGSVDLCSSYLYPLSLLSSPDTPSDINTDGSLLLVNSPPGTPKMMNPIMTCTISSGHDNNGRTQDRSGQLTEEGISALEDPCVTEALDQVVLYLTTPSISSLLYRLLLVGLRVSKRGQRSWPGGEKEGR